MSGIVLGGRRNKRRNMSSTRCLDSPKVDLSGGATLTQRRSSEGELA
jgi:hypothetical protein